MAPIRQAGTLFSRRRILILAAALVAVVLAYSAVWFAAASALEQEVNNRIKGLNGNGVRAYCEEPEAKGFPFRIGLFCRSVYYEDIKKSFSVRAGSVDSSAHFYQPFRVTGVIESPAALVLPVSVPLELRWESLRAHTHLARPAPERLSIQGRNIVVSAQEGDTAPLATISEVQAHAHQLERSIEAAINFRELHLRSPLTPDLPPMNGSALIQIKKDGSSLAKIFDLYGGSATIQKLVIGLAGEDAEISLSGPFSVDEEGRIDAQLSVGFSDPDAVMASLVRAFPEARDPISTAAAVLRGLGDTPIALNIRKSRVFLGIFPLGTIPPI